MSGGGVETSKRRGMNEPQIALHQFPQAIRITMARPGFETFSIRGSWNCAAGSLHALASIEALQGVLAPADHSRSCAFHRSALRATGSPHAPPAIRRAGARIRAGERPRRRLRALFFAGLFTGDEVGDVGQAVEYLAAINSEWAGISTALARNAFCLKGVSVERTSLGSCLGGAAAGPQCPTDQSRGPDHGSCAGGHQRHPV